MTRILPGVFILGLAIAQPALAQDRGFIRGTVGATMGAGPGAVLSGTVGVKVNPKFQITGEFGRMENVLPHSINDQIGVQAAKVANAQGGKHSTDANARASYGLFGARCDFLKIQDTQTFLEFGVGAAQVKSEVNAVIRGSASLQGDISNLVVVPFTAATPETKPLASFGMGATMGVTKTTAVEFGIRYVHIFTADQSINAGKVYGGFRFGF